MQSTAAVSKSVTNNYGAGIRTERIKSAVRIGTATLKVYRKQLAVVNTNKQRRRLRQLMQEMNEILRPLEQKKMSSFYRELSLTDVDEAEFKVNGLLVSLGEGETLGELKANAAVKYVSFIDRTTGASSIVANVLGIGVGSDGNLVGHNLFGLVILMSAIIVFALAFTREKRQKTNSFENIVSVNRGIVKIVRAALPGLIIFLIIFVGVMISLAIVANSRGHALGSFNGTVNMVADGVNVEMSFGNFFILTMIFYSAWLLLIAALSNVIAQVTFKPIVVIFVTNMIVFAKLLSIDKLFSVAVRKLMPSTYIFVPERLMHVNDAGALAGITGITVLIGWSVVLILMDGLLLMRNKSFKI